jgi:hypothetical protein
MLRAPLPAPYHRAHGVRSTSVSRGTLITPRTHALIAPVSAGALFMPFEPPILRSLDILDRRRQFHRVESNPTPYGSECTPTGRRVPDLYQQPHLPMYYARTA